MANKNTHNKAHAFFQKESPVLAWLASAVIILLFANAATIQSRFNRINERQAAAVPKASQNIGILEFSWSEDLDSASGTYQPQLGSKVVVVSTQIINLQQRNVWLEPNLESYVIDDKGIKYTVVDAGQKSPLVSGIHGPQTVASGTLAYAIPRNAAEPKWCYQLATVNGGGEPACIAINKYSQDK